MKQFIKKLNHKFGKFMKFPLKEILAIDKLLKLNDSKVYNFVELERYK